MKAVKVPVSAREGDESSCQFVKAREGGESPAR